MTPVLIEADPSYDAKMNLLSDVQQEDSLRPQVSFFSELFGLSTATKIRSLRKLRAASKKDLLSASTSEQILYPALFYLTVDADEKDHSVVEECARVCISFPFFDNYNSY